MMQGYYPGKPPDGQKPPKSGLRLWVKAALVCTLAAGLGILIKYGIDLASVKKTEAELKKTYYSSTETEAAETTAHERTEPQETTGSETTATVIPAEAAKTAVPGLTLQPTPQLPAASSLKRLDPVPYPNNPKKTIGYRVRALRDKNKDIIGWLSLDKLLEEAVVQRDNSYYMTHDTLKKKNANGAVFLDAAVSLNTRPYTLLLYGHNMRSGAMFGCLRNYENLKYYKKSPFVSFESLYEEGRYVIFAAGDIGLTETQAHYIDPFTMLSDRTDERQQVIEELKTASVFRCGVDVQPEDQLLLLVTCVDQDDRRRVVAARRLRPWETEKELLETIGNSTFKN